MLLRKIKVFCLLIFIGRISFAQELRNADNNYVNIQLLVLKNKLDTAPLEFSDAARIQQAQIELPYPGQKSMSFYIEESPVWAPEYAVEFPDIKTYAVRSVLNPRIHGRITYSPTGLFAFFHTPEGPALIRPGFLPDAALHKVFFVKDQEAAPIPGFCQNTDAQEPDAHIQHIVEQVMADNQIQRSVLSNAGTRRTYRVAIVTTGEFYQQNGSDLTQATTLVVNTISEVQAIYDRDFSIRFTLVGPQIYTDPATDPFPAGSPVSLPELAAAALDLTFDVGAYDFGHAFHNGSGANDPFGTGGIAQLAATCNSNQLSNGGYIKGLGWSGGLGNTGFGWVNLVAHEFGHMFFARHTFNGSGGICSETPIQACGLNTAVSCESAYEIGSGTTIMSYKNLCSASQNIASSGEADNYFHANSLERMITFIQTVSCASTVSVANTAPVVSAGADYTIPRRTPFELNGSATDAQGDALTYCWEQYDEDGQNVNPTQGFIGAIAGSSTLAPLFRSFPPKTTPQRICPSLPDILAGNNIGLDFEALASVTRDINFRLTVRDNNSEGGGIHCDNTIISVDANSGPFTVTSHNMPVSWAADGVATTSITWDVANTTNAPVSCANVDILFSADGGQTFPYILAENMLNDGSHSILIPSILTFAGRIKIICSDNIFFDINDADIVVTTSCAAFAGTVSPETEVILQEGSAALDLSLAPVYGNLVTGYTAILDSNDPVMTIAFDGGAGSCSTAGNQPFHETTAFYVDAPETYTFTISGNLPLVNLYQSEFNPGASCDNWIGSNGIFDSGVGNVLLHPTMTINLTPGIKYILALSSFNASDVVGVIYSSSGSGQFYDALPGPVGFSYTYLIVNQATGTITAFDPGSDLSTFPAGDYKVYGLSYDPVDNLSPYAGQPLSDFLIAILSSQVCANVSNNVVDVTITADPSGGTVVCEENLTVTEQFPIGDFGAVKSLSTSGTVTIPSGSSTIFRAGVELILNAGFSVELDAEFEATMEACSLLRLPDLDMTQDKK